MASALKKEDKNRFVYAYDNGLYVNLTNRCPTACVFCVKIPWRMDYRGTDLRINREPGAREVAAELHGRLDVRPDPGLSSGWREVVFCGYGEPTYRLDVILDVARSLRERGFSSIRLNTVGLGNLINGRDIAPEIAPWLESVSVSLNTADPKRWAAVLRPQPQFRAAGFDSALSFIRSCARAGLNTTVTTVEGLGEDIERLKALAESLGASFRLRPSLTQESARRGSTS